MQTGMPAFRNGLRDVEGARELVRLHADQAEHAAAAIVADHG